MLGKLLMLGLCLSFLKRADAGTVTFSSPTNGDVTLSVEEGTPTTTIVTFTATSTFAGGVTYADEAGNAAATAQFAVDSATGAVTLKTGQSFDFEGTPSYTLKVVATDAETPTAGTATGTATINVNQNVAPVFAEATKTECVSESTASGTTIPACSATDASAATPNSDITYSYSGDDTSAKFAFATATGILTKSSVAFVTATKSNYPLVIVAADGGTPSLSATCTLTVTVQTDCSSATVLSGTLVSVATALLFLGSRRL